MNKEKLNQYNSLTREIKSLEKRIEKTKQKQSIVSDKVSASNREFPYQPISITIQGQDYQKMERLRKLNNILYCRKNKCEDMKIEIETFISSIEDSLTRRVFQYRYIDNLSWQSIAMRIGRHDESYPRKLIHDTYLEGLE